MSYFFQRENSNQLRVQEVSGRNEEIVLTDGDDDDGQVFF